MNAGTELFLCCVLLNWDLLSCRPTPCPRGFLQFYMPTGELTFSSLRKAEEKYVTNVFDQNPPLGYSNKTWTLTEGITLSTNSSDIGESSCSIAQYLKHTFPEIVQDIIAVENRQLIIQNIHEFSYMFKDALDASQEAPCEKSFTVPRERYKKKVMGLRILYSTRAWLTHVTNTTEFN